MSKSIEQYERESFINESTKGIKVAIKFIIGILIFLIAMASYTICSSFYRINIYASEKILSNSVIEEGDDIYAIAFLTGTRQNLFFDQESNNREAKLQSL